MCLIDGAEIYDWVEISREWRTARKLHQCVECNRIIGIGECYRYHLAKCEGELHANKHCLHCDVAALWLSRECHGFLFQGVLEDIEQHFEIAAGDYFLPWMWLGRIVVGMKSGWVDKHGEVVNIPILPEAMQGPKEKS